MNKGVIIRASLVLGIFLVILGAAYGCSLVKSNNKEASVSNGDSIYLTLGDMTITKQELWETMKSVDGLDYLIDYVDAQILATYIDEVTLDEIEKEVSLLTYLTESADLIAEIKLDDEINQDYLDKFKQNLIILGYDPENADDIRSFVELSIAKTNMAKDYILASDADDPLGLQITEATYKNAYESTTFGDVCALEVRFSSTAEIKSVFDKFNLVLNYNTTIGKYFGEEPIADVSKDDFDATNTTVISEEEAFSNYVLLYNYMNPWAEQLPTDITMENLCSDYADVASYNYDEMTSDRKTGDPNIALANYIFKTLSVDDEDKNRFSYSSQAFSTSYSLVFKVSSEEVTAYDDLSATELAEFKAEFLDDYITDTMISNILTIKREEADFEIFDAFLKLNYEFDYVISFDNNGSDSVVARLGSTDITADDLFSSMEKRLGAFYSVELAKYKILLDSDTFVDIYGTDRNYMSNDSDEMIAHRDDLRKMKSFFSSNSYASYGFSSGEYTWEEFLYLAFNAKTESDVIKQLYVIGNLYPDFIFGTINYTDFQQYLEDQVTDYFSLDVNHLLLYVDFDKDFNTDSFDDLRAELTVSELATYTDLKVAYQNLVYSKVDEGLTFDEIVTEFEEALMDDVDNEWSQFKSYGFLMMSEDLSQSESLTNLTTTNYDETFVASLKRIYDVYSRPENEELVEYVDTQLTVSDFGIHLIIATPGSGFEQPTAEYELNADNSSAYTAGYDNISNVPSEQQINLYLQIKLAATKGEQADAILPNTVYNAIDAYLGRMYDSYFTQSGVSIAVANYMLANNVAFGPAATQTTTMLESITEVLYSVNFPEGFVAPGN